MIGEQSEPPDYNEFESSYTKICGALEPYISAPVQ